MNSKVKDNNCNAIKEQKITIYLIVLFLILVYISLFFIHNVVDIGTVRHAQLVEIDFSEKIDDNNNVIDNNNDNNIDNDKTVDEQNRPTNQKNNGENTNKDNENNWDNEITIDNNSRFKVLEGTEEWRNLKELNIFSNDYFKNQSIIAPGVKGKYSFTVENYMDTNIKYNIRFIEENTYNINIVYKLKLNGSYIAGSENQWVKCEDLCKDNLIVNKHTDDIFTIEWKWEDNYSDTQIGTTDGANYKLKIQLNSEDNEH